ncbi:MAG: hypothetical protein AAF658_04295 [Myxococcota bacterium]
MSDNPYAPPGSPISSTPRPVVRHPHELGRMLYAAILVFDGLATLPNIYVAGVGVGWAVVPAMQILLGVVYRVRALLVPVLVFLSFRLLRTGYSLSYISEVLPSDTAVELQLVVYQSVFTELAWILAMSALAWLLVRKSQDRRVQRRLWWITAPLAAWAAIRMTFSVYSLSV